MADDGKSSELTPVDIALAHSDTMMDSEPDPELTQSMDVLLESTETTGSGSPSTSLAISTPISEPQPSTYTDNYWIWAANLSPVDNPQLGELCGKWMIFSTLDAIDETWAVIKKATEEGKLGHGSKVSTQKKDGSKIKEIDSLYSQGIRLIFISRLFQCHRRTGVHLPASSASTLTTGWTKLM